MDDKAPPLKILYLNLLLLVTLVTFHQGHAQQAFAVQPNPTYSAFEGDDVLMLCSVSGKEGTLTWVKDSVNAISADRTILDPTQTQFQITGDDVSGSYNLNIVNVTVADSGTYECKVSAAGSSDAIDSQAAVLTVSEIPIQAFVTEPANAQGTTGNSVTLQCVVENKEGTLEWLRDGSVISEDTTITDSSLVRHSITGTQANGEYNLQIVAVAMSDAGTYSCRVSAAGLSAEILSSDAVLTVRDSSLIQVIHIPPTAVTATVGTPARLVCYVRGLTGNVLWLKDGVQISENRNIVNGDTSGRVSIIGTDETGEYHLYFSEVEASDQAQYFCVLTPSATDNAVTSNPATLTVLDAVAPNDESPVCTITPSTGLSEDDVVTIMCESTGGMPQPVLTWSNDLDASAYAGNQTEYSAHTTNIMTLQLTADLSGVVFTCRSTHPAYTSPQQCSLPPLTFELIATINVSVDTNRFTIEEDKPGEIVCMGSGDPPVLSYTWYYNGAEIGDNDARFTVSTTNNKESSSLRIVSATLSMDDSTVQCEARNRIDTRRTSVILSIKEDNLVTYVIAALGLIAGAIFVVIVVVFIIWVCMRMNKKKRTIHPSVEGGETKGMTNANMFIGANHMGNGAIPNGVVKTENEVEKKEKKHKKKHHKKEKKEKKDKKHKKDRHHKDKSSKVIDHDASRIPNPLSTRDGDHAALPTITGYRRPGMGMDPGLYPTYPPTMYPIDGQSPLPPHYHGGYGDQPGNKISLSPGEYQAREEYERKRRELQGLGKDLVNEESEKKKKKHKKHKKEKSAEKE